MKVQSTKESIGTVRFRTVTVRLWGTVAKYLVPTKCLSREFDKNEYIGLLKTEENETKKKMDEIRSF